VAELKTTFASHYTGVLSLADTLQLANITAYNGCATGEKFLICPNKGM
ncbi:MAG: NADH oxidase, partial [Acetobacteraceae bacterium]|nr:NADH oxidase [Acetobacteraceae bacterium]